MPTGYPYIPGIGFACRFRIRNKHAKAHINANPSGTPIPAPTATRGMVLEAHTGVEAEEVAREAGFVIEAEFVYRVIAVAVAVTVTVAGTIVEPPAMEMVTVAAVDGETVVVERLR